MSKTTRGNHNKMSNVVTLTSLEPNQENNAEHDQRVYVFPVHESTAGIHELGRQVFGNQYNSNFPGIYLSQDKCYEFTVTEVVAKRYIEATKIGDHFIVIPQTTDGLCLRMINSSEISLITVAVALINKKDFKFANIRRSPRHNDIILEVLSLKYYEVAKTLM
jgi:hypothetical protein